MICSKNLSFLYLRRDFCRESPSIGVKVKWCIYIAPFFPINVLKGTFQIISLPPPPNLNGPETYKGASGSPFKVVHVCWYSFYRTPEGWKTEWTLAGKKVTQIYNPRPGRESTWVPRIGRQRSYHCVSRRFQYKIWTQEGLCSIHVCLLARL